MTVQVRRRVGERNRTYEKLTTSLEEIWLEWRYLERGLGSARFPTPGKRVTRVYVGLGKIKHKNESRSGSCWWYSKTQRTYRKSFSNNLPSNRHHPETFIFELILLFSLPFKIFVYILWVVITKDRTKISLKTLRKTNLYILFFLFYPLRLQVSISILRKN